MPVTGLKKAGVPTLIFMAQAMSTRIHDGLTFLTSLFYLLLFISIYRFFMWFFL